MRTFSLPSTLIAALSLVGLGHGQAQEKPVELRLNIVPATVTVGAEAEVEVVLKVAPPWYIYGKASGAGGQQALRLDLHLPVGVEAIGEWLWSSAAGAGFDRQLLGTRIFKHKIRVTAAQRETAIGVTVAYQACNELMCAPPEVTELSASVLTRASGRSQADADWAAIEKLSYGPAAGYASSREDLEWESEVYKQKRFREVVEYQDRRLRHAAALAAAFYDAYPNDKRRAMARDLFLQTPPYFIKEYPPEYDNKFKDYSEYRRALPIDAEAMTSWRKKGDAMAAETLNSSAATLEEKEAVDWRLFLRDWHINAARAQLFLTVNWASQDALFDAHVMKYRELETTMSVRATSYLDGKNALARLLPVNAPNQLCERWLKSPSGAVRKIATAYLETAKAEENDLAVENPLEAVQFMALDGSEVNLVGMKGKVVYLDFWAMWCGPCVDELPIVKWAYNKYHTQGFEVIGFSCDPASQQEALKRFLQENGYTWPQHYDGKGPANRFAKLFDVHSWPTTYLIGKDGKVIEKNVRGEALEPAIRKALGLPSLTQTEAPPPAEKPPWVP